MQRPTVHDLTGDHEISKLARRFWLTKTAVTKVQSDTIQELWKAVEADTTSFTLLLLEQLQALERYLWPGYGDDSSNHHLLLLVLLANVKGQEKLPIWNTFAHRPDAFSDFFGRVTRLTLDSSLSTTLRTHLLSFVVSAFQSLETGVVRKECAPLVSVGIWQNLHSPRARDKLLARSAQWQKAWKAAAKKFDNADQPGQVRLRFERDWLYNMLLDFLDKLYDDEVSVEQRQSNTRYSERLLELLCDLQSQLPTRRYVNTLLQDLNLLPAIRLSPLYLDGDDCALLRDMHQLLYHYTYFPIDDQSGKQLGREEFEDQQNAKIARLQNVALKSQPEKLKILILANYGLVGNKSETETLLKPLSDDELLQFGQELDLRMTYPEKSLVVQDRAFHVDIIGTSVEYKSFYAESLRDLPVLPTERSAYDSSLLRTDDYTASRPLAIPKLNLQYLTIGDFLWRSFILFRCEAFYEVRKHVEDTIKRMQPRQQGGATRFDGFSRMAIPISKPAIIETLPPKVGEDVPGEIKSEIILDVSRLQPGLRREWESIRPDDVVYLVAVQPNDSSKRLTNGHSVESAAEKAGVRYLRCAEVISVLDDNGRLLRREQNADDNADAGSRARQRRLLVRLDAASYKEDKERAESGKGDIYESINVVIRRRARENNFRAVLESLKQLTLSDLPVPSWLEDVFLGYGDPSSASYKRLPNKPKKLDYRNTFLDWQHLIESLPGKTVEPDPRKDASFPPPYVLETSDAAPVPPAKSGKKRRRDQPDGPDPAPSVEAVQVTTYKPPNNGPYAVDAPRLNRIRFTPAQIEAITSGSQPGLTVIVGPPGTGKTDVTTQIINNIYHNFPQQRTLLLAHSNQALNQLFQKITALDIDERHLLRLGHGEEELNTDVSFTKAGRVESFLERGAYYLAAVNRLTASIGAPGAHGNSCETADYFDQVYVQPRFKQYWDAVEAGADIAEHFPFHAFFTDAPQPLFPPDVGREPHLEIAKGCERHIRRIFDELADIRPFEILRAQRDKSNYLLVKEARVIAMTTTHAAIRRQEIANLGFKYDNVIMEEAAQVTEAESFVPFVLQRNDASSDKKSLERVVLVGDHFQNSPVVQNAAFGLYANLEQSLFRRLIRLGVPHILLNAQGRSRPSLAELYRWRYPQLTNLPLVHPEFETANAGLRYDYQFIDVDDYQGKGETEPSPHFIQNLGEAEYAVALYQYMRLLGYPAERITILTTYAGQRALIRDVLSHRCKNTRLFGMPGWVGTVDKYQGEQNDYIILSMVRTKTPGYLRDIRRLTVALSRARLGLYVLGRKDVFQSSLELRDAFELLFNRETQLSIVPNEMFPCSRRLDDEVDGTVMVDVAHLGTYVHQMTQAKIQALKTGVETLPPVPQSTGGDEGNDEEEDGDDGVEDEPEEAEEEIV